MNPGGGESSGRGPGWAYENWRRAGDAARRWDLTRPRGRLISKSSTPVQVLEPWRDERGTGETLGENHVALCAYLSRSRRDRLSHWLRDVRCGEPFIIDNYLVKINGNPITPVACGHPPRNSGDDRRPRCLSLQLQLPKKGLLQLDVAIPTSKLAASFATIGNGKTRKIAFLYCFQGPSHGSR